ncbi:MAG TPA: hypothetical protein DD381_13085 [Lentisphaeria bacterium]|nr:MAG: hypothetical protein A2X47_11560 [Lentisphaerae bacterium GWF2_38_69]HBM17257.1 hypothetical protein [Lentisphaeria bacterium]
MTTKILRSFWDIVRLFFLSYKDNNQQYPYRLVEVKKSNKEEHVLTIKITNKNAIFNQKAIDLVNDDVTLKGFSAYDIRTICYYAFTDHNSPQFKIISQLFTPDANGMLTLKKRGEREFIKKHVTDIVCNEKIIQSIHSKDAVRLGYIKAKTEELEDNLEKEKLKKELQSFNS